jgi:hypothetical protein
MTRTLYPPAVAVNAFCRQRHFKLHRLAGVDLKLRSFDFQGVLLEV